MPSDLSLGLLLRQNLLHPVYHARLEVNLDPMGMGR